MVPFNLHCNCKPTQSEMHEMFYVTSIKF